MSELEIKKFIAQELNNGIGLSQIQDEIAEKFNVKYTFLEMRMLAAELENVDWKKLDPEPPKKKDEKNAASDAAAEPAAGTGATKVTRNKIVRPGAVASGDVTFASGATAEWILDQTGRLGLDKVNGKPTPDDLQDFQSELEKIFAGGL